jgi:hypothetical protein
MRNAPEGNYPKIGRAPEALLPSGAASHRWMEHQLDDALTPIYGAKFGSEPGIPGGDIPVMSPGWRLGGLLADDQTEREIARGQPPSYLVHVVDRNGQDQIARDPASGMMRFRWDDKSARAAFEAGMSPVFSKIPAARSVAGAELPEEGSEARRGTLPPSMVIRMPVQRPDIPLSKGEWVPSDRGPGQTLPRATPDWKKLGLDHPPTEGEIFMAAMRQNNWVASGISRLVTDIEKSPFLQPREPKQ